MKPLIRRAAVALALLVLAIPAASAGPAKKTSGRFLALTYNVAGLPQNISGSDPETNSPLIGPLLNDYDLVLLQEDWGDPEPGIDLFFHEEVTADAKHKYRTEPAPAPMGLDFRRAPTGPPLIADGLNRLSDFPFGTVDRQMWEACFGEFSLAAVNAIADATGLDAAIEAAGLEETLDDGSADCGAQKGFEFARVTIAKGIEIDVYNLHADAGGDPRDQQSRVANFEQLAKYIEEKSAGRPVIVGGDTNLHTEIDSDREVDIEVWQSFQETTGVVDVCNVLECGADFGAIDKFAFRSSKRLKLVPLTATVERDKFTREENGERVPLSDHDPLAVRFRWTKR